MHKYSEKSKKKGVAAFIEGKFRRFAAIIAVIAIVFAFKYAGGRSSFADTDSSGEVSFEQLCAIASGPGDWVSFCSKTGAVCVRTKNGGLMLVDSLGNKVFALENTEFDRICAAPELGRFLLYTFRNPGKTRVAIYDTDGSKIWSRDLGSGIWSADAVSIDDSTRFAIGLAERRAYIVDISKGHSKYRRWRTQGAVTSISLAENGEEAVAGTWQSSSVARYKYSGEQVWNIDCGQSERQYVRAMNAGRRLLLVSSPNNHALDADFMVLDANGERIWQGALESGKQSILLASPSAEYIVTGYRKKIEHSDSEIHERHATLYDSQGNIVWDKGSLFLPIDPLCVLDNGDLLFAGEKSQVFLMHKTADFRPVAKLPSEVVASQVSADGSRMLIKCVNGKTYLYRISIR